ncbi:MAG: hypothetical protein K9J30_11325 [Bacteroidales bacterium]|nr:hypothetical protein [Bacteroidales bacterium]
MDHPAGKDQLSKPSVFDKHPVLTGFITGLVIFIILDFAAGVVIIPEDYQSFRIKNNYYHHGIEPMTSSVTNWGQKYYLFYSNSLGFRDRSERKLPLVDANRRILFMGDSHTEGVGVNFEKTFAGRLASEAVNRDTEVLNASAVSYSPRIYYLKTKYLLEEVGLGFDELFVVLDMSDLNNEIAYEAFQPVNESALLRSSRKLVRKLRRYSSVIYLVDRFVKERQNKFFYEHMAITDKSDYELYATFFSEFNNADLLNDPDFHHVSLWLEDEKFRDLARYSLQLGQENIRKLRQLCDSKGIELTISVHPWQDQILKGDTTNMYVESWRRFASEHGIRFVNLFPAFINQENPVLVAGKSYIPHDNHWNEFGHEKVYRALMPILFNLDQQ